MHVHANKLTGKLGNTRLGFYLAGGDQRTNPDLSLGLKRRTRTGVVTAWQSHGSVWPVLFWVEARLCTCLHPRVYIRASRTHARTRARAHEPCIDTHIVFMHAHTRACARKHARAGMRSYKDVHTQEWRSSSALCGAKGAPGFRVNGCQLF